MTRAGRVTGSVTKGTLAEPPDTRRICLARRDPTRDDPGMTRTRRFALATSLTLAVAGAVLLLLRRPGYRPSHPSAGWGIGATAGRTPTSACRRTRWRVKPARADRRPKPPPTKGTVTGAVTGPNGTPIANALVTGIRFSDLGLPVDVTRKRVLARTTAAAGSRSGSSGSRTWSGSAPSPCPVAAGAIGPGCLAGATGEQREVHAVLRGPDGDLNSWIGTPGSSSRCRTARSAGSSSSPRPWSPAPGRTAPTASCT